MNYILIGTGNMAWLIASRMLAAGHTCVGIWGRNGAAVDELSAAYTLPVVSSLDMLHDGPDACIVAVSDSGIADVIKPLAFKATTLIHTAGGVPLEILGGHSARVGVVWPVYSIRKASLPAHRHFPAVIEANGHEAWEAVRSVAKAICDTTYETDSAHRQWLHLAAVMGNNFLNHLLSISADICAAQDIPLNLLQPLIEQTVDNMRIHPPGDTQTGPAKRHDIATIERHLSMLEGNPQWQALYRALSESIMAKYRQS